MKSKVGHRWVRLTQLEPTYGQKELTLDFKIRDKVHGIDLLEERQCLVTKCMHLKGKNDLNSVLSRTCFPYSFNVNS